MSDEQLQESATSEPQTNAREQELLNRIEALDRKNKEILEEKRKFSKVEKTLQTLPDGVDVQALIEFTRTKRSNRNLKNKETTKKQSKKAKNSSESEAPPKTKKSKNSNQGYESWNLFPPPYKPWRK